MVLQFEGEFQQFPHCKFKENVVRILYIPTLTEDPVFLVVNKFGKVGLYEATRFRLIHTYRLDLTVPMHPEMSKRLRQLATFDYLDEISNTESKCEKTHLVVDAVYCPDLQMVCFITTKGIIQCYDLGELETQSLGVDLLPRKEFMQLKHGQSPTLLRNKGHIETHRIFDLSQVPTCLEYFKAFSTDQKLPIQKSSESSVTDPKSRLFIGDFDGGITILTIDSPKYPFLGKRKIRGITHKISLKELEKKGKAKAYHAHIDPVKDVRFLAKCQLIISCSRDRKFSLFCEELSGGSDSLIISVQKGVNTLTYLEALNMIVTGSEDGIVRLFSEFSMKMPQTELSGHKSSIMGLEGLSVPFTSHPILISYSADVEVRAWNPITFQCLQSFYLRFPPKSTIMCKTPEFAKRPLQIFQPHFQPLIPLTDKIKGEDKASPITLPVPTTVNQDTGFIILIYCNSYARLSIEKDTSHWPFNFEAFIRDFQEASFHQLERQRRKNKLAKKHRATPKDPNAVGLSEEEEQSVHESSLVVRDQLMTMAGQRTTSSKSFESDGDNVSRNDPHGYKALVDVNLGNGREVIRAGSVFDKMPYFDIKPPKLPPFPRSFSLN